MGRSDRNLLPAISGFPGFRMALQPIVDVRSGCSVFACEALVRGENGESAASVLGSITSAHLHQFDAACRAAAITLAQFLNLRCRLSFNIPVSAVCDPRYGLQATLKTAKDMNWPANRLIMEVTECEPIHDPVSFKRSINAARNRGMSLAIDDFGAGYSNLMRFLDLRPDYLKLDMELVRSIDRDRTRQALVAGVVNACTASDCKIIAEGVETPEERVTLESLGIQLMQGFLFGRPSVDHVFPASNSKAAAKGAYENVLQS